MVEFNDIQLSPEEKLFYSNVFNSADTTKKGFFSAPESVQLWKRSKLPEQVLSQIWNMVEKDSATGNVRTTGFAQALRLMSAAQNQRPIDLNAMNQPAQVLVKLEGFESSVSLGTSASVLPLHVTVSSNPDMFNIPPADKQRYLDMFNKSQRNQQIDANSARSIFLQSRLQEDFLSQVWKLVDTQQNGFLNQQSFLMAMWLIQLKLQGVIQVLPASIPPSALQPSLLPSSSSVLGTEWVMPVDERAKAEQFFSNLDTTKRGYLNPDEVVNFFKKSELPDQVLSQIWELMDYDKTSNRMVDKERFCIGWFLIQKKRNGAQLPPTLPKSLLPNSLVHSTLVSPAASMFGGPLGLSSSIADVPGLKEAKSAFLEKQKEFNLIQDKNNQLQRDNLQVQNDLAEYTAKKAALENKIKSLTAEQKELEEKLQASTALKDAEYKSFLELQSTYTSISAQITSLRAKVEIDNRESEMLKQRTSDGKKWINDLTEELQMLESQNAELEKIKLDLENQFKRQQAEYEELQRKIETAKEQAPKLQNDISKLTEQIASKKVDVMELKQRASFGPTPVLSVKKATESEIPVSAVNWDARSITSAKSDSVAASIKPNVVDRKDSVRSFSAGVSPAVLVPLFPDTTPSNKSNLVSPPTNAIFETTFDDAFSSTPSPAKPERTAEKVPIDVSSAFSDAFNVLTTEGSISSKKAKDPFSDFEDLGSSSPTKSDIKSADSEFQEKFPTLDNFEKQMESKGIITEAKNDPAPAPSKTKSPFDDFEEEFKKLSTASPSVVTVAIEKDFTADFFESNPFGENKGGLKPKKSPTMESGLSSPVTVGDDPFATKGNLNQLADGNEPFKFEDFSSAFPDSNSNIAKVGTQLSTFDNDPFATTTSKTENPFGSTNVFQEDPFSTFDKAPAFSEDPFAEKKPTSVTSGKQKAPEASIKEVMDMGFTEAQASDALSRYDFDVPKAVHFLLDQSNGPKSASSHKREGSQGSEEKKKKWWNPLDRRNSKLKSGGSGVLLIQLALAHKGHSHSHDSHDGHNHGESDKLIEFFKSKWTETVAYLDQNFPNEMAEFYKAEQQHKVFEKASTGLLSAKTTAIEWLKNTDPLRSLAVVAGAIVFTPLLLVQLLPAKIPEFILLSLVGFAVGTLLSDVFVHILPHTFSSASNEQDKILVGLCVVGGIVGFVVLDKFIRALSGSSGHHHDHHHNHSDKKNDGPVQGNVESFGSSTSFSQGNIVYNDQQDGLRKRNVAGGNPSNTTGKSPQKEHKEHKHSHGTHETKPSSFGYLTVVANILHTVSDGFTLAVAHYSSNPLIAFSTSLAIFLHEVPHKMGDYAIMRKSGFSKGYAFFMQVLLSLGTLLGVGLGMYVYQFSGSGVGNVKEDIDSLEKWILPATAGGLLYTACVGILPEILESNDFFLFMFSLCSLLNGVIFMTAISLTE